MNLLLKRMFFSPQLTIGKLFIDGKYFCDTLEDTEREVKIQHETCIPRGQYEVIINYSNRFKKMMPLLLNVPNFTGIRIHAGNTHNDTSGCILIGYNTSPGKLTESRDTYIEFIDILRKTTEPISILIEGE